MVEQASEVRDGYLRVARHPRFGRVLPGLLLSGLGDGISLVAIPWLALEIAGGQDAGLLVGAALACFQLPGALAVPLLSGVIRRLAPNRLAAADGLLRAVMLVLLPVLAATHLLDAVSFLVVLSVSSLLSACGIAGRFAFVAGVLDGPRRLTANAIALSGRQATQLLGALVAAPLIGVAGTTGALGVDALTFAALAIGYLRTPGGTPAPEPATGRGAFTTLWRLAELRKFVGLSFCYALLMGMPRAAIPILVVTAWHGDESLLGMFWTVAGGCAVLGGLATRLAGRYAAWPVMTGIAALAGILLIPLTMTGQPVVAVALFGLSAAVGAPLAPLSFAMTQLLSPPGHLPAVLAARSGFVAAATPAGNLLGGAITVAFSAGAAVLATALVLAAGGGAALAVGTRLGRDHTM